jgi:ATP-dependent helicase/nuclease subunit B
LLYHLVKRYIENQLKAENEYIRKASENNQFLTVLALESKLKVTLQVALPSGTTADVLIKGLADRIDRLGSVVRVIDYKTGRIGSSELSFREWEEPFTNSDKAKNFQLLCYAWMYHKMNPEENDIEPGIISTRTPAKGSQTMKHPGGKGVLQPQHLAEVEKALHQLISEILDPSQDFIQTQDIDKCKYCNFKMLCGRYQAV